MARVCLGNIKGPKGDPGPAGPAGPQGEPGYTPVKGVDYFTPEEIEGIVGFGLGPTSAELTSDDDLNNIKTNGWYCWEKSIPKNVPNIPYTTYMNTMRVWTHSGAVCCQELMDMSDSTCSGCKIQRIIYADLIGEWEWVNPPMMVGVEYRTTERWNGKPVYAKLDSVSASPTKYTK